MQIFFNFDQPPQEEAPNRRMLKQLLRRAAVKWLLDQTPGHHPALGVDVPVRGSAQKADIAAAWLEGSRTQLPDGHMATLLAPRETAVIICSPDRSDCWPQCAQAEKLLREIAKVKGHLKALERTIRREEPELREQAALFDEYAIWNYKGSKNQEYRECLRLRDSYELSLFKGSRLARICNAQAANRIYLAVPEGTMQPDEILDGWGLLAVNVKTYETVLLKEPENLPSPPEIQAALAFAIADSATKHVAHCHGIKLNEDKTTSVVKMPIFRRTPPEELR